MYEVPEDFQLPAHVVLENKVDKTQAIKLLVSPYEGIIFSYGKVSFDKIVGDADEEHAHMHFEYNVHDYAGKDFSAKQKAVFEEFLGDFLRDLIIFGINENNISYTGGIEG